MLTNIPDSALPTELAEENRISSTYTTNTLIPRLGPLGVVRTLRVIDGLVADFRLASEALKRTADYMKKYDRWIELKPESTEPTAPTEPREPRVSREPRVRKSDFRRGVSAQSLLGLTSPGFGNPLSSRLRDIYSPTFGLNLDRVREVGTTALPDQRSESEANQEVEDLGSTLYLFARDSRVISDLVKQGLLAAEGELLSEELKGVALADIPEVDLMEILNRANVVPPDTELAHVNTLVQMALNRLPAAKNGDTIQLLQVEDNLRVGLGRYVWGYFRDLEMVGGVRRGIPSPSDTEIFHSEWAFQRTERLDVHLSQPEFRGPISSESLAPNSSLKTVESYSLTRFSGESGEMSRNQHVTELRSQSYSQSFQLQLNNMTEEGIQRESEFSETSTLFNTLRERRRTSIDQVIREISHANEQSRFSGQTSTSHSSREHLTQGVDRNRATTELAFQVVSPVQVEVRLEDVGLAWCPRIDSPFINLHQLVNDHMTRARSEYLDQNMITDPIRPAEVYERAAFTREIAARGTRTTQAYSFEFPIPANYQGWTLDNPSSGVVFRNGRRDDYDWSERGNWDDLENDYAYFASLESDGVAILGCAVLTTTDPEFFNKGFLTFEFGLKKLTLESEEALRQYAQGRLEAENQRLSAQARANQYARLRRDELIESYSNQTDLQEEAFRGLIRQIFESEDRQSHSYYAEVLRSCINWDKAGVHYEAGETASMPYPHLAAAHFLNTPAIRLILPIYSSAEETFFNALEQGAGDYHRESAHRVQNYVANYRKQIDDLRAQDDNRLLLDSYRSELVLGRHLEAVLSKTPFQE